MKPKAEPIVPPPPNQQEAAATATAAPSSEPVTEDAPLDEATRNSRRRSDFAWRSQTWMKTHDEWLETFAKELDGDNATDPYEDGQLDLHASCRMSMMDITPQIKWILFQNVCESILYNPPWRIPPLKSEERKRLFDRLVEIFFTSSPAVGEDRKLMRQIILQLRKDNAEQIMQGMLAEFMRGEAWTSDEYRAESNFIDPNELKEFRAHTEALVQRHLHILNKKMSSHEDHKRRAVASWKEIQQSSKCFGGTLTVFMRKIFFEEQQSAEGASPAVSEKPKDRNLPKHIAASVELCVGGQCFGEVEVRKKPIVSEDRMSAEWVPPQAVSIFVGGADKPVDVSTAEIIIRLKTDDICGFFQFKTVSTTRIPLKNFYDGNLALNHALREKLTNIGLHFLVDKSFDTTTGFGTSLYASLECLCAAHNEPPPCVDPNVPDIKPDLPARCSSVWNVDHHQAFLSLVDMMGELSDGECAILRNYADRFLLHEPFVESVILFAAATRGDFENNADTRELALIAVRQLATVMPNIRTKQVTNLAQQALLRARQQAVMRLSTMEDCVKEPTDAHDVMRKSLLILTACGVAGPDVIGLIEEETRRAIAPLLRKIKKLQNTYSVAPHDNRMSRLVEFDEAEDKSATGKAAILFRWLEQLSECVKAALKFGTRSESDQVLAFALRRTDIMISELLGPLSSIYSVMISDLVESVQPVSPLGDTFAILGRMYSELYDLAKFVYDYEPLRYLSPQLMSIFESFLSHWVVLCETKAKQMLEAVVERNPLVASLPGKRFANDAPADAISLLNEMYDFFAKCAPWGDPSMAAMNVPSFCSMMGTFGDHFMAMLLKKGQRTDIFEEQLVVMSSLCKFDELMRGFWRENIFGELLNQYEDESLPLKCSAAQQQCISSLLTPIENYSRFIKSKQEARMAQAFVQAAAQKLTGEALVTLIKESVTETLDIACKGLDSVVCNTYVLSPLVEAVHNSIVARVIGAGKEPRKDVDAQVDFALLEHVDTVIHDVAVLQGVSLERESQLSQHTRIAIQLCMRPTSELGTSVSTCGSLERELILSILRQRGDREAQKYLRQQGSK